VGQVGRTHGVDGEVYVDQCSLTAEQMMTMGSVEWRSADRSTKRTLKLHRVRATHDRLLVRFDGITVREVAARLTNGTLWVDESVLPDPGPGVAYTYQLVGLRVVHVDGREIGKVKDVVSTTDRMFYVVEGHEMLMPAHEPFVKHVDLAAGVITLDLPPGFLEP